MLKTNLNHRRIRRDLTRSGIRQEFRAGAFRNSARIPHQAKRCGISLLEVILALAILAVSSAYLAQSMQFATNNALRAERLTQAELVAESVMNQVIAGVIPAQPVSWTTYQNSAGTTEWMYQLQNVQAEVPGMVGLQVAVQKVDPVLGLVQTSSDLYANRWIIDPALELDIPPEVVEEEATETSGSASSGGTGSAPSGGTGGASGGTGGGSPPAGFGGGMGGGGGQGGRGAGDGPGGGRGGAGSGPGGAGGPIGGRGGAGGVPGGPGGAGGPIGGRGGGRGGAGGGQGGPGGGRGGAGGGQGGPGGGRGGAPGGGGGFGPTGPAAGGAGRGGGFGPGAGGAGGGRGGAAGGGRGSGPTGPGPAAGGRGGR